MSEHRPSPESSGFGWDDDWGDAEGEGPAREERQVGAFRYEVVGEGQRAKLDFGGGFNIGFLNGRGRVDQVPERYRGSADSGGSLDLRDLIAEVAGVIRTDNRLFLPGKTEIEEGENGLVYFTLPDAGLRLAIRKDRRGNKWVEEASDAEAALAKELSFDDDSVA
jgi:hypothetical protein